MKRLLVLTVGMCLFVLSGQVQAQTWSPAEKEVLQALEDVVRAYQEENLEAVMAFYHDDFVGFRYGAPNTFNKADLRKSLPLNWANQETVEGWVKPLNIRVAGNAAVIHHYQYTLVRDKDGKETDYRGRWTEFLVKQGGKWLGIADHGGLDPGVKPSGE